MKYISAEQFLEQPKEVQKALLDWWKPSIGDLYSWVKRDSECDNNLRELECCNSKNIVQITDSFKGTNEGNRIPLLTEGQLREFIEDREDCKIDTTFYYNNYDLDIGNKDSGLYKNKYGNLGNDLLQAYWKVACKIAKEVAKCK